MSLFTGFTNWDDFFNNINTGCCPITYCVLKTSDDGGSSWPNVLSLANSDHVYMDANNDILAKRNVAAGYSIQFKVTCNNDAGNIVEDTRFEVILAAESIDCSTYDCSSNTPTL